MSAGLAVAVGGMRCSYMGRLQSSVLTLAVSPSALTTTKLGVSTVNVLSDLIGAGVLVSPRCRARQPGMRITDILQVREGGKTSPPPTDSSRLMIC